ncbi:MAG TPA: histidine kinase, partial [Dyadobacter sp.]|nr:histidine kinase [Dyadobacter sp.]
MNLWLSFKYDIRETELLIPPLAMKLIKHIVLQEVAFRDLITEKLRYKIQVLRSQTAPHFLLNTMTAVMREFRPFSEKAANYIDNLSDVLAFSLYHTKSDIILFKTEWNAVTKLLNLEASRFTERLKVSIQLNSPVLKDKFIPSMVLFTIVENALKHGLYASIQEECRILIKLEVSEKKLYFTCTNSIPESVDFKSSKENSGLGLSNITERLELICKDRY